MTHRIDGKEMTAQDIKLYEENPIQFHLEQIREQRLHSPLIAAIYLAAEQNRWKEIDIVILIASNLIKENSILQKQLLHLLQTKLSI